MTTIGDFIEIDKLKGFGMIRVEELDFILYKSIYNDCPLDSTGVYHGKNDKTTFNHLCLEYGKITISGFNPYKLGSFYCLDFGKFFSELKPIYVMGYNYFINYDNSTLYRFGWYTEHDRIIIHDFTLTYGYKTNIAKELEFFNSYFKKIGFVKRDPDNLLYVYQDRGRLNTRIIKINSANTSDDFITKNYNDDIPYPKIENFITNKSQNGICLLHGDPGTGKSTLIRHLITKHTDCYFYYIPSTLLFQVEENELSRFLFSSVTNSVYIIEDCEALILDRNKSKNFILPTLLNFSDGILGDAIEPKFILTFNCPQDKIDKAVLRKGRLKIKYEFKPLCLEKTKKLLPSATQPMPLCDIYNTEDNGNETTVKKKIGF